MNWHQKSGLQFNVTCSLLGFVCEAFCLSGFLCFCCGFCLALFVVVCGFFVCLVGGFVWFVAFLWIFFFFRGAVLRSKSE